MEQCIKFKGEKVEHTDYRKLLTGTFLAAFVLSMGIFGEENLLSLLFYTLYSLLIIYLPLRIIFFCLFRFIKFRGFTLDDNAQNIITEKGRIIPYNKVKAVIITKTADSLTVQARPGIFTKHFLLFTGNIKKENELFRELKNRFVKVRIRKMSPIIIATVIIAFAMVSFTCYAYFRYPGVRIFSEKRIQKTQKFSDAEAERYTFNKISFSLPKNFRLTKKKRAYIFSDKTEKIGIYVDSAYLLSLIREEPVLFHEEWVSLLFVLQLGLKDDYDLLNIIYNSHMGLLPLGIKIGFLRDYASETLKIYEIRKNEFKGFLMLGRLKNGKSRTDMLLTLANKKSDRQINFCIRSKNGIKEELADMIINGLELTK